MKDLLEEINACNVCAKFLNHEVRPVMTASEYSKIVIIGQAPGSVVHHTGIPWNDKSGDNLRSWMGINKEVFYDSNRIALVPMGFCYPGKGESYDLPPRKECAPLWHQRLLEKMPDLKLTLLVGIYAQKYYLKKKFKKTLTETVRGYSQFLPEYFVLPHPSPRNNIWQKKNPWFKDEVLSNLEIEVAKILSEEYRGK